MTEESRKDVSVEREGSGGLLTSAREPLAHLRDALDRLFDKFTLGWTPSRRRQ